MKKEHEQPSKAAADEGRLSTVLAEAETILTGKLVTAKDILARKGEKKMTETEMQTIAAAVRLLSNHGMLEIKVGKSIIPAMLNQSRVGPLTLAAEKTTGDLAYLIADSGIAVRLEDLTFRMTHRTPKTKTAKAGS
jgi:hypothetical protein